MKVLPGAAASAVALVLVMLCFSAVALADTESDSTTLSTTVSQGSQGYLRFSMVPSPLPDNSSYRQGNGSASLEVQGSYVAVHFEAEGMASRASLALVLLVDGSPRPVANMTTSYEGEVEAETSFSLGPGSYSVGLEVVDTSTFTAPTTVLVSSPAAEPLTVSQSSQTTSATTEYTQPVTTVQGGETEDEGINAAIQTRFIPAVVDVGQAGPSIQINDGNFSVSVGKYLEDGYLVSIYAANVSGPRVLLVNLTSAQARSLFSGPVLITLDGAPVQQAGSLSEVLGAKAGDPPMFVLVSSPSALNLLISIPHFSYHAIGIIPIAQAAAALLVDLPVLILAVAAVSAVVLAAYSRRTRVGRA